VRKELPVERLSDHSSERWKYLDVKATRVSLLFPYLCCKIFVLTLIPERFTQYNHVCNRQIAGRANTNVTATTSTRDLSQNNADIGTLLKEFLLPQFFGFILDSKFKVYGSVHCKYIPKYIQQDANLHG
jgi:hypothetical protein